MSDAEWAVIEPTLPAPAWLAGKGGRPARRCRRDYVNAIRYLVKEGIQWRAMPADLPGDQLPGAVPVEVHAGGSEFLHEYVDLVVEPRTSGHVASLPSSRHGARLHPNGRWR